MSSILFEKVMNLRMDDWPSSVGAFSSKLNQFESIRNFFTATTVEDGYMFNTPTAPIAKPGAYVILEARTDLVCAVSSCPYDLTGPGWAINSPDGPTEIEVEML